MQQPPVFAGKSNWGQKIIYQDWISERKRLFGASQCNLGSKLRMSKYHLQQCNKPSVFAGKSNWGQKIIYQDWISERTRLFGAS